jgi:hypothetical protein
VEFERQAFREAQGFVTADGARAFLSFVDGLTAPQIAALHTYDSETRRHLDAIANDVESSVATRDAIVSDDLDDQHDDDVSIQERAVVAASTESEQDERLIRGLLEEAQLLVKPGPMRLLTDGRGSREPALTAALRRMAGEDPDSFHARARELAYLANVLRSALSIEGEALDDRQASDAAFAICNLGFELSDSAEVARLNVEPGLIRLFMMGWNALQSIPDRAVAACAKALSRDSALPSWLRGEATGGLADLRRAVESRQFEDARDAVVFLSIAFDSRSCRAIALLLDAIPRFSSLLDGAARSEQWRWITTRADMEVIDALLSGLQVKVK